LDTINVFLTYPHTNSQSKFSVSMKALHERISGLSGVVLLDSWRQISGQLGVSLSEAYSRDMANVNKADLVVAIYENSVGSIDDVVMEIVRRCEVRKPIRIFVSHKGAVSPIIEACIAYNKVQKVGPFDVRADEIPNPTRYFHVNGIFELVAEWVNKKNLISGENPG